MPRRKKGAIGTSTHLIKTSNRKKSVSYTKAGEVKITRADGSTDVEPPLTPQQYAKKVKRSRNRDE